MSRLQRRSLPSDAERRVACPTCKAAAGDPCDPRTLGRHPYHRARLDAAEAAAREASRPRPEADLRLGAPTLWPI